MNRTYALLRKLLLFTAVVLALAAQAQTRHWVGGDGSWSDAAHWSDTPGGSGGAGVPGASHAVVVAASTDRNIVVDEPADCGSLSVDARNARITFTGADDAELSIACSWSSKGDVAFDLQAPIHLTVRRQGVELDLRGADISGDLVLDGTGSWSLISDIDVRGDIRLVQGTLIANVARISAQRVVADGSQRGSILAGRSIWVLEEMPVGDILQDMSGSSTTLTVGGEVQRPGPVEEADDRDDAGAVYPYEIIRQLLFNIEIAEAQWKAQPNYINNDMKFLPVIDCSGSMLTPIGKTTALDIAISLGIYLSESNTSTFKDSYITFSKKPTLQYATGSLLNRYNTMENSHWEMNTDLIAVFKLILDTAIKNKIKQEDMPTHILIVSDMQFDYCIQNKTPRKTILDMYKNYNYIPPTLVFWNVKDYGNKSATTDSTGTILVSGFSPSIMTSILSGEEITPEKQMLKTLMNDKYKF